MTTVAELSRSAQEAIASHKRAVAVLYLLNVRGLGHAAWEEFAGGVEAPATDPQNHPLECAEGCRATP